MATTPLSRGSGVLFRHPLFWVLLGLASLGLVGFTVLFFPRAFPLLTLDLRMDRAAALQAASDLAARQGWGPSDYRQAVRFARNDEVQSFVELEAGGADAFRALIRDPLYSPFYWEVRHFRPEDANETRIFFAPDGKPLGFAESIPEARDLPSLGKTAARELAARAAKADWGIELDAYELVEVSEETRPNKRVDHTLVYERAEPRLGAGRYRLRLVVTGNRVSQVAPFIRIPEAFTLRFREMRSANETLSVAADVAVAVLYGFGGVVFGLMLLLRRRWVLWRAPLVWGGVLATLVVLMRLNAWPLVWMEYDTAVSAPGFVLDQITGMALTFVGVAIAATLVLMAAESLSRRAFPHHLRLWGVWSPGVGNSPTMLGRTVGGYLAITADLAYVVAVYLLAHTTLGWWSPSDTLVDPNILAHLAPWYTPLAGSLLAGFVEECLFRAVPLAGAALIGRRYGREGLWIAGALILQAVIFGTAHANYPTQPAYARAVELFLPSVLYGLLYLRFGLIFTILLHAGYDAVLFATPLFASAAPGSVLNQGMVVLLGLTPLWVLLYRRARAARWVEPAPAAYNGTWQPPSPSELGAWQAGRAAGAPDYAGGRGVAAPVAYGFIVAGALGFMAWALTAGFNSPLPPVSLTRQQAVQKAREVLSARKIELAAPWRALATLDSRQVPEHQYVWREGGADTYAGLLGTHLPPTLWQVRFARFEGDVVTRAEEYRVFLAGEGEVVRLIHMLPESAPGARIDRAQAGALALKALQRRFGLHSASVREVSVEPEDLPGRRDWTFSFARVEPLPIEGGEARIQVGIAGDEVVDAYRHVHIPEAWQRAEESRRNVIAVLRNVAMALLVIGLFGVLIRAAIGWANAQFAPRVLLALLIALLAVQGLHLLNAWPETAAGFSTSEPLGNQVFARVAGAALRVALISGLFALLAGFLRAWTPRCAPAGIGGAVLGIALGGLLAGAGALVAALAPTLLPPWPLPDAADHGFPLAGALLARAVGIVFGTLIAVGVVAGIERFTEGWSRRRGWAVLLIALLGFVVATMLAGDRLPTWFVAWIAISVLAFVMVRLVLRYHVAIVAVIIATLAGLGALRDGLLAGYPGAGLEAALGIGVAIMLGALAYRWMDGWGAARHAQRRGL